MASQAAENSGFGGAALPALHCDAFDSPASAAEVPRGLKVRSAGGLLIVCRPERPAPPGAAGTCLDDCRIVGFAAACDL